MRNSVSRCTLTSELLVLLLQAADLLGRIVILKLLEESLEDAYSLRPPGGGNAQHCIAVTQYGATNSLRR